MVPISKYLDKKVLIFLLFIIEFIRDHVFYITFIKDVMICLFSFSNSLIKFVSKCYVVLLVNVIGILSERFVVYI